MCQIKENQFLHAASLVMYRIAECDVIWWIQCWVDYIQHQTAITPWLQLGIRVDDEETNVFLMDVDLVVNDAKLAVDRLHEVTCSSHSTEHQ